MPPGAPLGVDGTGAAVALVAPAAHADSSASVPGAKATFTSSNEVFRVYDTACDGNPVYLVLRLGGGPEKRLDFSGGCNENSTLGMQIAEDTRIDYKVCVNITGPDRCSVWTTDTA